MKEVEVTLSDGTKVVTKEVKATIRCYTCHRLLSLPLPKDAEQCCFDTVVEAPDYAFKLEDSD